MNQANCINFNCVMREKCSHAIVYNNVKNDETFETINPAIIETQADGKCQFYTEPYAVTIARGFKNATDNMSSSMKSRFAYLGQRATNHTDYYAMQSGRKIIMPYHQEIFLRLLKKIGYTPSTTFWDESWEETCYF